MSDALKVLRDKPDYCYESGCPLAEVGKGFVLGQGDPERAKIMIILEAPGSDEIQFILEPNAQRKFLTTPVEVNDEIQRRQRDYPDLPARFIKRGVPIVGKSGSELMQWVFPQVNLRRHDFFIDNTLRCLPPKAKKTDAPYPKGEERKAAEQCCRHWDRLHRFRPTMFVITLHPAGILREVTPLPLQIEDLKKARDFAATGERVLLLMGGKSAEAFARWGKNVTKWRGDFRHLPSDWVDTYKQKFAFTPKGKKKRKAAEDKDNVLASIVTEVKKTRATSKPKVEGEVPRRRRRSTPSLSEELRRRQEGLHTSALATITVSESAGE